MKKRRLQRSSQLLIVLIAFFTCNTFSELSAQCMMIPLKLQNQITNCDLIVEGVVVAKESFTDRNMSMVYTSNKIKVTKVFKGEFNDEYLELITSGGFTEELQVMSFPSIELNIEEAATFFLIDIKEHIDASIDRNSGSNMYNGYASSQSVFSYSGSDRVMGLFGEEGSREKWYENLQNMLGHDFLELSEYEVPQMPIQLLAPSVSSISPTSISAGTLSELTITGSGFGATRGSSTVDFHDANDGGASWYSASANYYQSWSDTEIKVIVPRRAGTGTVRIAVAGEFSESSTLTIRYSLFDASNASDLFRYQHANVSGNGGYEFQYFTDFNNNSNAVNSFERALKTWQCEGSINFEVGDTTTADSSVQDQINVVRFDNGAELPSGVAGRAHIYISCYIPDLESGPIKEIDIVFNDDFVWEYSPASPSMTELDFESVALHELGHCASMGHVIDASNAMHWATEYGDENRDLIQDNLDAADDLYQLSTTTSQIPCGFSEASYYDPGIIAKCKDISVTIPAAILPSHIDDGSTSNCDNFTLSASQTDFDCPDVGAVDVTLTVTDDGVGAQSSTCVAVVTVIDNSPPSITLKNPLIAQLDAGNSYTIDPADLALSIDNCSSTLSVNPASLDLNDIGINDITITAEDPYGNSVQAVNQITLIPYTTILYVDENAAGQNTGSSWIDALNFIGDALDVVHQGFVDTVKVAEGFYYPDDGVQRIVHDRESSFHLTHEVVVQGGYISGGWVRDPAIYMTNLSGNLMHDAPDEDNSLTIVKNTTATGTSILDGVIIDGGFADVSGTLEGRTGAGFFNNGNIDLNNCIIRNNEANDPTDNGVGAGAISFGGTLNFYNCLFHDNLSDHSAGAASGQGGNVDFYNCTFVNNHADNQGGAIHHFQTSSDLINCIFIDNSALNDSIMSGLNSTIDISYSLLDLGLPAPASDGGNNIFNEDAEFYDPFIKDYRLRPCSEGVDVGDDAANSLTLDLDFRERKKGQIDMGAYEAITIATTDVDTLYVDHAKNGDGSSWAQAIPSLAEAAALADLCGYSVINVAEGTYYPDDGYYKSDSRKASFEFTRFENTLEIFGGFSSTGERNWNLYETILSGEIQQDADSSNNAYSVINLNAGGTLFLDGLTIERGYANSLELPDYKNGAGMVSRTNSSLSNCIFRYNRAANGVGGAIFAILGISTIRSCLFHNNFASTNGGAIYLEQTQNNYLASSTFVNNTSGNQSAAFFLFGGTNIVGCIFADNNANTYPDIFAFGAPVSLDHSLTTGGITPGIIVTNSLLDTSVTFVDPDNRDYTLKFGSAGIDEGIGSGDNIHFDINYNTRNTGVKRDMGAFEFQFDFPCGEYAELSIPYIPIFGTEYKASGLIQSIGTVDADSDGEVIFNSESEILLSPGFEVKDGQLFQAIIEDPCEE